MPQNEFEGVKDWPATEPPPAGHNKPPLEIQVVFEFESGIQTEWLDKRVNEITDAAGKAPAEVTDADTAGAVGDLIAQAKAVTDAVQAQRELINRPLLTAQRALKGRADGLLAPMELAIAPLRTALDAYVADHAEVTHGDMGARVSARTTWDFEIVDMAKLPLAIRRHPTVIEAIEKVIRGMIKSGERKIAGVKIWSEAKATIR